MNNYQTGNIKLEKLAKENSAFQNCQPDMSDVNFEIGKSSSTVKIFAAIAAFALIYGIRFFLRRYVGNPNGAMSAGDIVFWCFIGLIIVLVVVTTVKEKNSPTISVMCKQLFYTGNCWSSD